MGNETVGLKLHGQDLQIRVPQGHKIARGFERINGSSAYQPAAPRTLFLSDRRKPLGEDATYAQMGEDGKACIVKLRGEDAPDPVFSAHSHNGWLYFTPFRPGFLSALSMEKNRILIANAHIAEGIQEIELPEGHPLKGKVPVFARLNFPVVAGHLTASDALASQYALFNKKIVNPDGSTMNEGCAYHLGNAVQLAGNGMDADLGNLFIRIDVAGFGTPEKPLIMVEYPEISELPSMSKASCMAGYRDEYGFGRLTLMSRDEIEAIVRQEGEAGNPRADAALGMLNMDIGKRVSALLVSEIREKILAKRQQVGAECMTPEFGTKLAFMDRMLGQWDDAKGIGIRTFEDIMAKVVEIKQGMELMERFLRSRGGQ